MDERLGFFTNEQFLLNDGWMSNERLAGWMSNGWIRVDLPLPLFDGREAGLLPLFDGREAGWTI